MRKQILNPKPISAGDNSSVLDVEAIATVIISSEAPGHPVEHAFDGQTGPGGTQWKSDPGIEHTIILAFDEPRFVRSVSLEVEETERARTQELELAISQNGEKTYQMLIRQEFNFDPNGATFERENWKLPEERITHLRLRILPCKNKEVWPASITSLVLGE